MTSVFSAPGWRKTALGSPIDLYASRPLEQLRDQRPILLMGGVHGDEPEGVRLANDTLEWLKKATAEKATLVPWVLVPCLNVDGLAKQTRGNGRGVDLNRNYPSKDWTPKFEKERYFPGTSAASEPEVQAVVELIQTLKPRLVIHCHSWKPCIVGTGAPSRTDTQRLAANSGYNAVDEIGYPTPGSLSGYGWHDLKIPVICIEEDDTLTDYEAIWPRFSKAMKQIFEDLSPRTES